MSTTTIIAAWGILVGVCLTLWVVRPSWRVVVQPVLIALTAGLAGAYLFRRRDDPAPKVVIEDEEVDPPKPQHTEEELIHEDIPDPPADDDSDARVEWLESRADALKDM